MSRSEHSSAGSVILKILTVLVIIAVIAFLFVFVAWGHIKKAAVSYVGEKVAAEVIEKAITSTGIDISSQEVEAKIDSFEEEDKEAISQIIDNHANSETIERISEYAAEGDMKSAAKYAKESLSQEEIDTLQDMYNKYFSGEYGNININP
ncbi:hypothetical protein [Butyrivibrio sp. MC2013]|uniref:hypothetical protein n=1 Tax=Butyrivibrio sp. MC2013 TaxID=1280686 RepID=UPI0004115C53|nr:hypothetical protein [Butyrivibrio sp. MC2013]